MSKFNALSTGVNCSIFLADMIGTGWYLDFAIQATARVAGSTLYCLLKLFNSVAVLCISELPYLLAYRASLASRPFCVCFWYFPVERPAPSGEYEKHSIFKSWHAGNISTSACRFTRLYIGCAADIFKPKFCAINSAFVICHAAKFDTPQYLIVFFSSCSENQVRVFSRGVSGSNRWRYNKSIVSWFNLFLLSLSWAERFSGALPPV